MWHRFSLPMLSCGGCGACCEEQGLPPSYTNPDLLDFLPTHLRDELAEYLEEEQRVGMTRNQRGLPCIWLDVQTRKCRHYELRPNTCRDFEVGGYGCKFWLDRQKEHAAQASG